jgi:hypothetical protein
VGVRCHRHGPPAGPSPRNRPSRCWRIAATAAASSTPPNEGATAVGLAADSGISRIAMKGYPPSYGIADLVTRLCSSHPHYLGDAGAARRVPQQRPRPSREARASMQEVCSTTSHAFARRGQRSCRYTAMRRRRREAQLGSMRQSRRVAVDWPRPRPRRRRWCGPGRRPLRRTRARWRARGQRAASAGGGERGPRRHRPPRPRLQRFGSGIAWHRDAPPERWFMGALLAGSQRELRANAAKIARSDRGPHTRAQAAGPGPPDRHPVTGRR